MRNDERNKKDNSSIASIGETIINALQQNESKIQTWLNNMNLKTNDNHDDALSHMRRHVQDLHQQIKESRHNFETNIMNKFVQMFEKKHKKLVKLLFAILSLVVLCCIIISILATFIPTGVSNSKELNKILLECMKK
jgi:predicted PurR-regulated permease PerM